MSQPRIPTNLTPEYRRVEAAYRKTSDPAEKLTLLKQMLSVMPKHKGTDHLQAEVKSRFKELTEELGSKGKAKRSGPSYVLRPEGGAQIALIGPPNTGKSALHAELTGARRAHQVCSDLGRESEWCNHRAVPQ